MCVLLHGTLDPPCKNPPVLDVNYYIYAVSYLMICYLNGYYDISIYVRIDLCGTKMCYGYV